MKTLLRLRKVLPTKSTQPFAAILGYAEMSLAQFQEVHAAPYQKHIAEAALCIAKIVLKFRP